MAWPAARREERRRGEAMPRPAGAAGAEPRLRGRGGRWPSAGGQGDGKPLPHGRAGVRPSAVRGARSGPTGPSFPTTRPQAQGFWGEAGKS